MVHVITPAYTVFEFNCFKMLPVIRKTIEELFTSEPMYADVLHRPKHLGYTQLFTDVAAC